MENLTKIKRISFILKIFFIFLLLLIPLIYIYYWLFFNHFSDLYKARWGIVHGVELSLGIRLLALMVNIIIIAINVSIFP